MSDIVERLQDEVGRDCHRAERDEACASVAELEGPAPATESEVMPNTRDTSQSVPRLDNATPRPAHSPAGAEPWVIHSYLPGEFAIARSGAENYARHTLVNAHSRKDAEFIVAALNAFEAAPQVTDEMVTRLQDYLSEHYEVLLLKTEASAALTAALHGKEGT